MTSIPISITNKGQFVSASASKKSKTSVREIVAMVKGRVILIEGFMAAPFIRKWHYSQRHTKGSHHYFGWFIGKDLYAVADYGIGSNPYQAHAIAEMTMLNVKKCNCLELKRLCRIEPKREVNLTHFLARCHKILKKMGYVYVVSFTDPEYGHTGGVYKAANFEYLGETTSQTLFKDTTGNIRHRRIVSNYAKNNSCSFEQAIKLLKLKEYEAMPKQRWLLCINKKKRRYEIC